MGKYTGDHWEGPAVARFDNNNSEYRSSPGTSVCTNCLLYTSRREVCRMLINNPNKVFNEEVIKNNKLLWKLIPVKKDKEELSALSHFVCTFCGGLISEKYFSSHKRTCEKP